MNSSIKFCFIFYGLNILIGLVGIVVGNIIGPVFNFTVALFLSWVLSNDPSFGGK